MPLVGVNIGHSGPEVLAPAQRVPLIADVAKERRVRHFRNIFPHHVRVSRKAAAGKNKRTATNFVDLAIGATIARRRGCGRSDRRKDAVTVALRRTSMLAAAATAFDQRPHQFRAGPVGRGMHAEPRVPGIIGSAQQRQRNVS